MSNDVYLLNYSTGKPAWIHDHIEDGSDGEPLAWASYQIPILWLALFTDVNLTTALIGYDQDANEQWLKRPEPTLFTSREEGLATYARRRDALRIKLGAGHARYVGDWERMLVSGCAQGTHFQIEFSELNGMYEEGEFEPILLSWLDGIESMAGPGWDVLCTQANLNDPDVSKFGIRGWTNHEALGWGDWK